MGNVINYQDKLQEVYNELLRFEADVARLAKDYGIEFDVAIQNELSPEQTEYYDALQRRLLKLRQWRENHLCLDQKLLSVGA